MLENTWQDITNILSSWLDTILPIRDLVQITTLVVVLIVAWLLQFPLRRILRNFWKRLKPSPWVATNLPLIISPILLPLTTRLLGQLAVEIFRTAAQNSEFLILVNQLITLWFVYRLVEALLVMNLAPGGARFWSHKVVLPLILIVSILNIFGLLTPILTWGLPLGQIGLNITVGSLILGTGLVFLFYLLSQAAYHFLSNIFLPKADTEPALTQIISKTVSYTIVAIGVLASLTAVGVNLTGLSFIAGGISVGVGFGLKEIISNFVSGFILLFERSLSPGDVVRIGERVGVVQTVGIRSITIRTRENIEMIVPNLRFLTETVTNLTRSEQLVMVPINIGVSYESSPHEVKETLLTVAIEHPQVLDRPAPSVEFRDFGDSSLNFELEVWTREARYLPELTSDLRFHIWDALKAKNISIPFPQRDIHIRSGSAWLNPVTAQNPTPAEKTD